jgi:hypothetical protein
VQSELQPSPGPGPVARCRCVGKARGVNLRRTGLAPHHAHVSLMHSKAAPIAWRGAERGLVRATAITKCPLAISVAYPGKSRYQPTAHVILISGTTALFPTWMPNQPSDAGEYSLPLLGLAPIRGAKSPTYICGVIPRSPLLVEPTSGELTRR